MFCSWSQLYLVLFWAACKWQQIVRSLKSCDSQAILIFEILAKRNNFFSDQRRKMKNVFHKCLGKYQGTSTKSKRTQDIHARKKPVWPFFAPSEVNGLLTFSIFQILFTPVVNCFIGKFWSYFLHFLVFPTFVSTSPPCSSNSLAICIKPVENYL